MATPKDLLSALGKAYALTDAPFDSDQEYLDALQAVVDTHDDVGWFVVRVEESGFHLKDQAVEDLPEGAGLLGNHLRDAGIAELRFQETLQIQILQEFFQQVRPASSIEGMTPSVRFRGFEECLGLSFIGGQKPGRGMAGGIQELFRNRVASPPEVEGNGEGPILGSEPAPDAWMPTEVSVGTDVVEDGFALDEPVEEVADEAPDDAPDDGPDEAQPEEPQLEVGSDSSEDEAEAEAHEPESEFAVPADFGAIMDRLVSAPPTEEDEAELDVAVTEVEDPEPADPGPLDGAQPESVPSDEAPVEAAPPEETPSETPGTGGDLADTSELAAFSTAESELRDRVRDLTAARDFKGLADLVVDLVDPANEKFPPDLAEHLAEEFTTPAVASSIVAALAAKRDEAERAKLGKALARIGREGPPAVADALEQARDRSERRALVEAMVALGSRGFGLAQRMVEDPRWYVVRNGVSVMGEVGGEEAVTHLTATLASPDPRVRKETVRALAKLGGDDADALVLGMLADPEPPVRAVACRAAGVLGLERAVRPLIELLKDSDQEVQVEAIQALGLIGDPGPVQQIEKKALGGFLAKPAAPIRVAAFRALAAIGTPRALKTVQKGALDSDPDVKASVRSLLRT